MQKTALNIEIATRPKKVVVILSPCRSGSTALLNSFAMAGWQSLYQPVKAALRRSVAGDNAPVVIRAETSCLVIKETLGPYNSAEVNYDPLGVLMEKGIDPKSIHVIALMRRPEECLDSWIRSFRKDDVDLSLFGASYNAVIDSCMAAQRRGAHIIPLRYEELAFPETLPALLTQLGLPYREEMVKWTKSEKYQAGSFGFEYVSQPNHDQESLDGGRGIGLMPKLPVSHIAILPDEITTIAEISAAHDGYEYDLDIFAASKIGGLSSHRQHLRTASL